MAKGRFSRALGASRQNLKAFAANRGDELQMHQPAGRVVDKDKQGTGRAPILEPAVIRAVDGPYVRQLVLGREVPLSVLKPLPHSRQITASLPTEASIGTAGTSAGASGASIVSPDARPAIVLSFHVTHFLSFQRVRCRRVRAGCAKRPEN